ncbi:MAG: type 1 glutamine amidotransferase [Lachnospiraceae bacterium]|nr:type 1 glutamine amidotransferase [Lachnospiraceae bacterium]
MKRILIIGKREVRRNENYYAAVEACGAEAISYDFCGRSGQTTKIDGIVIPGGADMNPALYHEENTDSIEIDDELDQLELAVIREAVEHKKPILGICRGHQILNVFFGGSLIQNVEGVDVHERIGMVDRVHMSRVKKNSFVYDIYQEERISINSAHHQAIKELAAGLEAVQFSDDGLIEAFYHTELPVYGVQWHPERMCLKNARPDTVDGLKIFEYFINRL